MGSSDGSMEMNPSQPPVKASKRLISAGDDYPEIVFSNFSDSKKKKRK